MVSCKYVCIKGMYVCMYVCMYVYKKINAYFLLILTIVGSFFLFIFCLSKEKICMETFILLLIMYECKDTDIHTLKRVRHVCLYARAVCMYYYMHTCMYVLHVCTECLYVYMYACMYVCMYMCMAIIRRLILIPLKSGVKFDFHEWILHGLEVERGDISNSNHNQLHIGLFCFLWIKLSILGPKKFSI